MDWMEKSNRAALYCRLSQEDRDKSDPSAFSRSIENQRQLLLRYATDHGWQVVEVYCDDDYSGSDRNRPEFQRLIADARRGKFAILLCKSQSRFTRELELVEKYIHGCFVDWGVRFIGVADHVDSAQKENRKARQLSGLINQWYLEDLSDSIKAVLHDHQRQGRHIGSFAPYGYQKDPDHPGHLLPDEEAAQVVRRIFREFAEGHSKTEIAHRLNEDTIPNPAAYKEKKGSRYRSKYGKANSGQWRCSTISSILRNRMYIGSMVQHRSEKSSYKSGHIRPLPREQWVVVEDCHEPLVERELFEQCQ